MNQYKARGECKLALSSSFICQTETETAYLCKNGCTIEIHAKANIIRVIDTYVNLRKLKITL